MIVARLKGGIGNQLFIYSYGLYLSNKLNRKLYFDKSPYYNLFSNSYNEFCKKYNIKFEIDRFYKLKFLPNIFSKLFYNSAKLNSNISGSSFLPRIYNDDIINQPLLTTQKFILLNGYYIKKDYAIQIREDLILNNINLTNESNKFLNNILKNESVSLHIRGKQYIEDKNIKSTYALVSKDYYANAIKFFKEKLNNPIFYIFTNDLVYAKRLLNSESGLNYIATDGPDFEHFYLMSKCKHNIIMNSTFSWWAAFLNSNKYKIIVSPKTWSGERIINPYYDYLNLDGWNLIENV